MKNKRSKPVTINMQMAMSALLVWIFLAAALGASLHKEEKLVEYGINRIKRPEIVLPTLTPTPTPSPTPSPTPTPLPTPTPTPIPSPFEGQSSFKPYENYRNITNTSSPQYRLQQEAYTGDYGIRMVGDRYCVAMGSYWATKIGTKMDIYLESGEVIKVILGDNKQDCHTTNNHRIGVNDRDVIEFIVDIEFVPDRVIDCGNFNYIFKGKVSDVVVIEE